MARDLPDPMSSEARDARREGSARESIVRGLVSKYGVLPVVREIHAGVHEHLHAEKNRPRPRLGTQNALRNMDHYLALAHRLLVILAEGGTRFPGVYREPDRGVTYSLPSLSASYLRGALDDDGYTSVLRQIVDRITLAGSPHASEDRLWISVAQNLNAAANAALRVHGARP